MNLSVSLSPRCVKITALCAHRGFHEVSSQRALTFEFFDWKYWFIIPYKVFLLEHLTPHKHFYGPMNLLEEKEVSLNCCLYQSPQGALVGSFKKACLLKTSLNNSTSLRTFKALSHFLYICPPSMYQPWPPASHCRENKNEYVPVISKNL